MTLILKTQKYLKWLVGGIILSEMFFKLDVCDYKQNPCALFIRMVHKLQFWMFSYFDIGLTIQ